MALSEKTIEVVKATAPVVAENAVKITTTFYETMFTNNPEALRYFNKTNQVQGRQQQALADSVVAYASNIDNLGALAGAVEKIGHRHVALSITPDLYGVVHKNLMLAIGKVLGDAVTPEIGAAWDEAVLALAKVCIDNEEALYKKLESRPNGWRYEKEFKLVSKTPAANDFMTFVFAADDVTDEGYGFTPAQYVTVRIPGLEAAPRHYTVTNMPGEKTLEITTHKETGGVMSTYMHENLAEGDPVLLASPCGVFLQAESEDDSPKILISAGSGVTPMRPLTKHFGAKVKAVVHFGKDPADHPFADEFKASGVPCFFVYSDTRPNLEVELGKVLEETKVEKKDVDAFVCGPPPFMQAVRDVLQDAGVSRVNMELFGTGSVPSGKAKEEP